MKQLEPIDFDIFANGIVSAVNPLKQSQASIPHALNFLFDEELGSAVSRKGLTEIGAGTYANPVLGLHIHRGVILNYDAQSGNFTAGLVLTGGTSGATAIIVNDADSGTTGKLTLKDIVGHFQDNETITDSSTG